MLLRAKFLKIGHHLADIHGVFQNCLKYLRFDQNSKAKKWYKRHPYNLKLKILLSIGHEERRFYIINFFRLLNKKKYFIK